MPGVDFNNLNDLQEVNSMLAERVIEWTEEWEQQGIQKGMEQGMEKGMEKGVQKGEATLLLRLMELRFGSLDETIRNRLQTADAETLLRWGDRVLSATSAEDALRD
jgi:flagellar biosynthesis/type III secretory pathway protein FliH